MYHSFLTHSSTDGLLSCFHVLAIVYSAIVNTGIHVSLSILVSSACMPSSGIAGSYGRSTSSFLRISMLFSTVAVPVCIPTRSVRGFPFSTPSPAFIACRLFDDSFSDWHEIIPHCGFDLHFSDNECTSHFKAYNGEICEGIPSSSGTNKSILHQRC